MVVGYIKSKEGVDAYTSIGLTYPPTLQDEDYEAWVKDTNASELPKYSKHKPVEVTRITRIKTGGGGGGEDEEYITYNTIEYRLDKALNVTHRPRSGHGTYPNPVARYTVTPGDFGVQNRTVSEVISTERCYSIPFTPENIDKIKDLGMQFECKVGYSVMSPNGMKLTVASYEDLRNGSFEELCAFGYIPSPSQREKWMKEGGASTVEARHREAMLQKDNRNVPQKPVTADQVRQMLKEEHATTSAAAIARGTASPVSTNTNTNTKSKPGNKK
jgi:hypothetical protein